MKKKANTIYKLWLYLSLFCSLSLLGVIAVGLFFPLEKSTPPTGALSAMGGLLTLLKLYAIPLGLGLLLLALLSFWMYTRTKGKKEMPAQEDEASLTTAVKTKRPPLRTVLPLLFVGVLVFSLLRPSSPSQSGVEVIAENRSTHAQMGDLETFYLSSGTLSESESQILSFGGDVRLLQWEVEENQIVVKGQRLATVDKNSVLSSISQLKELMDKLDKALEKARYNTLSSLITAPATGRIVAVYANVGDKVLDCMGEHGALMLLSLDGKLSLDIPAQTLCTGDILHISRSNGDVLEAYVAQVSEGLATVCVGDSLCQLGEEVTALSAQGEVLGKGALDVHRGLKLTGIGGTVNWIYAQTGASVWAGQTLISLGDVGYSGEYDSLLEKRAKLEEQIAQLSALYEQGALLAPENGYVTNLNRSASGEAEDFTTPDLGNYSLPFGLTYQKSEPTLVLLGNEEAPPAEDEGEEAESYTLMGQATAVDMEGGFITILCFDGSELTLPLFELVGKCGNADPASIAVGNLMELSFATEDNTLIRCTVYVPAGESQIPSFGGFFFGDAMPAPEKKEESYLAEETPLCTLMFFDKVDISLSIDELDIRSLSIGQEVEVTVDALGEQVFPGTIREIDPNGTNNGGNSKYTVLVTMDRTNEMLSGMNVTVRIPLQTHSDLLLLPAEAIMQDEQGSYVYTSFHEKEGYGHRKDITTGLSDGKMVEILSGLSDGDAVYYPYADALQYSFANP